MVKGGRCGEGKGNCLILEAVSAERGEARGLDVNREPAPSPSLCCTRAHPQKLSQSRPHWSFRAYTTVPFFLLQQHSLFHQPLAWSTRASVHWPALQLQQSQNGLGLGGSGPCPLPRAILPYLTLPYRAVTLAVVCLHPRIDTPFPSFFPSTRSRTQNPTLWSADGLAAVRPSAI